jgi:hypothetical protein
VKAIHVGLLSAHPSSRDIIDRSGGLRVLLSVRYVEHRIVRYIRPRARRNDY